VVVGVSTLLMGLIPVVEASPALGASARWATCGEWSHVPVTDGRGSVTDVAVVSPTDAWVITDYGYESFNRSYIYRWRGTRWSRVRIPPPSTGDVPFWSLEALAVVTPSEIWAVGFELRYTTGSIRPITARWNGRRWRWVHVRIPRLHGNLQGAAAVPGTHRVWAVGHEASKGHGDRETFVLLWNGQAWRRVESPHPGRWSEFVDVTSVGGATWALGSVHPAGRRSRLLAAKWTGGGWAVRTGPRGRIAALDGARRRSLWAVGRTRVGGSSKGLIAHWNGESWVVARRLDRVDSLGDVAAPGASDVWAVGNSRVKASGLVQPVVLHRRAGGWRFDRFPDVRGSLTTIDGTPHNLWTLRTYHAPATAEIPSFDAYHRC
jgi:hypothetical protein